MPKITAKRQTFLKWDWSKQAAEQPPNHVIKCIDKKTLHVSRALWAKDRRHIQVFFEPPINVKLHGVSTVWPSGYLFADHWDGLADIAEAKPSARTTKMLPPTIWNEKDLSWKNWLNTYSAIAQAPPPSPVDSKPQGCRRFRPQEFRPNSIAAQFIGHFEGLELRQYYCSAGVSTIGIGTTRWTDGGPVPVGATITKEQAIAFFKRDAAEFVHQIQRLVDVQLTARQIAAVLSFCYNCGWQGFESSSLRKSINDGSDFEVVRANFRKWCKADGQTLPGLLRRRNAEAMLWQGRNDWDTAGFD